jgi:hypothetical protein
LITTDRDFARFPGLRWRHPLAQRATPVAELHAPRRSTAAPNSSRGLRWRQ